jgi:hypothetical protein
MLPIKKGLEKIDALKPLLFNFALGYAVKRVQTKEGLKFNGTQQFLVYTDAVNLLGESIHSRLKTQKLYYLLERRSV